MKKLILSLSLSLCLLLSCKKDNDTQPESTKSVQLPVIPASIAIDIYPRNNKYAGGTGNYVRYTFNGETTEVWNGRFAGTHNHYTKSLSIPEGATVEYSLKYPTNHELIAYDVPTVIIAYGLQNGNTGIILQPTVQANISGTFTMPHQ